MINRSFYFLRHGETDENVRKVLQGNFDSLLNAHGRAQAENAARILEDYPIDRIVASPLKRAAETAQIVNRFLQKPLDYETGLRERSYGLYEGKTGEEIAQWKIDYDYQDGLIEPETRFAAPPNGEIYADFKQRVFKAFKDVIETYPTDSILFVSHGGVFKSLHLDLLKERVESKNAHPYHFDYTDDTWTLNCLVTAAERKIT